MVDPLLETLVAKQAITEVLYRYCRGLDRMDRGLALSVWHPGGTADYGPLFHGTGEEFVTWVWRAHEQGFVAHSHQITNILIEVDGQEAVSEAYVTVALRTGPTNGRVLDIVGRGRYLDRWSQRDGTWAIDHRQFVDDFQSLYEMPLTELTDSQQSTGRRGLDDPSYRVLQRGNGAASVTPRRP
jgi:hypothetical protein